MTMEQQYLSLLNEILTRGKHRTSRTGVDTISLFGYQMRCNLTDTWSFPLITTKKINWNAIVHELLWFIKGDTNIAYLKENKVNIWDEWADEHGDLGPVYGHQWRNFGAKTLSMPTHPHLAMQIPGVDQLKSVIYRIKTTPDCRRLIVSAWNPVDIPLMALPPCHCLFQFHVQDGFLSLQLYQRSADVFLGVPFNIASYALLLKMVAHECDLYPGDFVHTFGDVHLYKNHTEQAKLQLSRQPFRPPSVTVQSPQVEKKNFFDLGFDDIQLWNYEHHPFIKAEVAV